MKIYTIFTKYGIIATGFFVQTFTDISNRLAFSNPLK